MTSIKKEYIRRATHAGSWYSQESNELQQQLQGWLDNAQTENFPNGTLKAIIAPHAGYSYSGPTAAFAYKNFEPSNINTIFVLGPSHHVYMRGCAISGASKYMTPIGEIAINKNIRNELLGTSVFELMSQSIDEDEHSIEMHLPYIYYLMRHQQFQIVPIMVGATSPEQELQYGRILAPYLEDPHTLFVISSDFCHWGSRFRYQPYDEQFHAIHQYIEWLDHEGMQIIESKDPENFIRYLEQTENTICGRHPISVLLYAVQASSLSYNVKFVRYAQSSQARSMRDSSVSYASAIIHLQQNPNDDNNHEDNRK